MTLLALACLALLSGCFGGSDDESSNEAASTPAGSSGSSSNAPPSTGPPKPLTIGYGAGPSSLNPAKNAWESQVINSIAYEPLIHQQPDGSYRPGLATSWGYVGTGNKVFRLKLRKNARFSDGTPVNAAAVKKWFEYYPTAGGAEATIIGKMSVETPDDSTVVLRLKNSTPDLAYLLSSFNNWGHVAGPAGVDKPSSLNTRTLGAGQYVLDPGRTTAGDHYTYVPNKHYYDQKKIRFSKIVFRIIESPTTMLRAAQTGQLDVAAGDPSTADAAKSAGLNVVKAPTTTAMLMLLDRSGKSLKPLADVRVRQALNYAIDREAIARGLMGRYAKPAVQLLTTDVGLDPEVADMYPYDPEKAKALLREAGYPNGFTLPTLTNTYEGQTGQPTTQAVAKYLNAVGVKVKMMPVTTSAEFIDKAFGNGPPATQLSAGAPSTALEYGYSYKKGGLLNKNGWSDPVIDRAYARAQTAENPQQYWREIMNRTVTQALEVPIYVVDGLWYVKKDIGGLEFSHRTVNPLPMEWYRTAS